MITEAELAVLSETLLVAVIDEEVPSIVLEHQPLKIEKSVGMSSKIMPPHLINDNGDL